MNFSNLHYPWSKKNKNGDGLEVYTNLAQWIPLSVDPFIDIGYVLLAGIDQNDDCDDATWGLYNMIISIQPKLEDVLEALSEDLSELQQFTKHLRKTINSAKTNDTSSLKSAISQYVKEDPNNTIMLPKNKSS
ncbi:hypothetical protein E4T56_gene6390 [Termitomyces sp. T112]|nr:hypothetical protein E4T56_gene6390 [Termitomyces sp. T112]